IEDFRILIGEEYVRRQFSHHVDLEAVPALDEPGLAQHRDDALALLGRAAERHHHGEVLEPELLAHALDRAQFEQESLFILWMVIARGAAPADHRIFFRRLELPSAQ